MSRDGLVTRLLAFVRALLPEDWRSRAGKRFCDTTAAISDFAEQHQIRPKDLAEEGVELARTALHGKANKDLAAAVRDFADAERTQIDIELQRRSMESKVRKEEAEAALAELQVVNAEADLLKKLQELEVVIHRDAAGHLTVLPSTTNLNLGELADERIRAAVQRAERIVLGTAIADNVALSQIRVALRREDFSSAVHMLIFESILAISRDGRGIDMETLVGELTMKGAIEAVGGQQYVRGLVDGLPISETLAQYLEFLHNKKHYRGVSRLSGI